MILAILLTGCAALLAMLPEADVPPCMAGTWVVSCTSCDPTWTETVEVRCGLLGTEGQGWEVELVEEALAGRGGLSGWRAPDGPGPAEDLVITNPSIDDEE